MHIHHKSKKKKKTRLEAECLLAKQFSNKVYSALWCEQAERYFAETNWGKGGPRWSVLIG